MLARLRLCNIFPLVSIYIQAAIIYELFLTLTVCLRSWTTGAGLMRSIFESQFAKCDPLYCFR